MRVWSLIGGTWKQGEDRAADAWWFDITGPHDGLSQLAQRFNLHPLAVEDCYSPNPHVPKIDDFGAYIFVIVQALVPGGNEHSFEEIDAFIGPNFVITYADRAVQEIADVHASLKKGVTPRLGVDGLFHAVFDRAVDALLPAVNALSDELDGVQERVVQEPAPVSNTAILEMRAQAGQLRRVLTPQMDVAIRLSRGDFAVIHESNRIYYRDIYDHLARVDLALEAVREDADVALSTVLSVINNQMSDVMKVL
jgi:magnesium transporter